MPVDQPDKSSQKSQFAKLHGLIIGINNYKAEYRQNLQGCVSDAMSIFKFFTDFGAPHENLLCLYDEQATRERILSAFEEHLIKNPKIQKYDPIVIYFAGHGDRMPAPAGWRTSDGMVEMILPHDASYASSGTDNPSAHTAGVRRTNTLDETRNYVYGIPDLTLAFLLYRLSEEKGNNITVILDSCHSGSGTRGEIRSRNSHDSQAPPIPSHLDLQVRKSMSAAYPSELKHVITTTQTSGKLMAPSLETHILLAACQYDELAQEIPNFGIEPEGSSCGGIFTTTLLKELRRCDIGTTSYTTFIRNLLASRHEQQKHYKTTERVSSQTFQCEGQNQDRLLFSVQYSTSRGKIALMPTKDRAIYRVRVGSAQGIVPGTEFRVFADKMHPNARPIILVARDVGSLVSHLHGQDPNEPPEIPEDAYATIIKYNDHSNGVRIWVDDAVNQNELWKQVIDIGGLDSLPISWATSPENHDVALLPSNGSIELRASHLTPGQLPISHVLKKDLDAKKLNDILASVVDFHFHLKIQNKIAPVRAHLGMALRELGGKYNNWGAIYEPKGDDLFGSSVTDGTVATLHADPKKPFGIELTNRSMVDLYPYVFYYDFEDYSVGCLYGPPGRTVRAPLPAGNSLTIGYGSGGSQPFQVDFTNPKSEKEYGAFVLMVFSNWVDVSYLRQQSPFEAALHRGKRPLDKDGVWDSITVRVELVKGK